jgi:streptomycin 6-kinase
MRFALPVLLIARIGMSSHFAIPESLIRTTTYERGPRGTDWLRRLPTILDECERRWSLTLGPPFPQLSYNYAAPAQRADGMSLVVKVGFSQEEFNTEAEALRLYAGGGAVRLLDFDPSLVVMLLERLTPGEMLASLEDDVEATSIAASVMKRIRRPAPADHPFPTVAGWASGLDRLRYCFDGGTGPFSPKLVDQAKQLFSELIGSMGESVVLHGDLHHFNILSAEREPWLAIDPQGVVGEAEYETGALLRNPSPAIYQQPHLERVLARRMDQLSEVLGFDRERVRGWAVATAVLSVWWYFEDKCESLNDEWRPAMEFAETIARVR